MKKIVIHNHLPAQDASEGMKAFIERKAAKVAEAKTGEERMTRLLERVKVAQKTTKKRGESLHHGYAANAESMVKQARASFSLVVRQLNDGALYKFDELMARAKDSEDKALEAVAAIERQASQRR